MDSPLWTSRRTLLSWDFSSRIPTTLITGNVVTSDLINKYIVQADPLPIGIIDSTASASRFANLPFQRQAILALPPSAAFRDLSLVTPRRLLLYVCAAFLALLAGWSVLELTEPPGPGLDPDALAYLGSAVSLANGHGYRVPSSLWAAADTTAPLAHFPPGVPTSIALGIAAGTTPENSARFVQAASAAVTVLAIMFATAAAGQFAAGAIAVVLFGVTATAIICHASVLSEPLFLALLALFVWQLARPRSSLRLSSRTIALGVISAAAALVRYAGISLVGAALLDALLAAWLAVPTDGDDSTATRMRRAVIALATTAVLPFALLATWTLSRPKVPGAKIRTIGIYVHGLGATLVAGGRTMMRWLAPSIEPAPLAAFVTVLVWLAAIALIVRLLRTIARAPAEHVQTLRLLRALALTLFCYSGLIAVSRLFADGLIPLDERILAPAMMMGTIAFALALQSYWRHASQAMRMFSAGMTLAWIFGSYDVASGWVRDYRTDGGDLAGRDWQIAPIVEWARTHPGVRLYSNWPAAIWFHTGRAASELPYVLDATRVRQFRVKIEREHGALLAFSLPSPEYASTDSLAQLAGLIAVQRSPLGVVWRAPADSSGAIAPNGALIKP